MKKFKIRELEAFSGIKAHTIRIWEQRYAIFKPGRTDGNMRLYSLDEVRRLLDISLLLGTGYKISVLASMDETALLFRIEQLTSEDATVEIALNELIVLMYSSQIEEFEDVLDAFVHVSGIEATMTKLILPFLRRINLLSYHDTSPDVHFVVTVLRKKIILAIETSRPALMADKKALLFLPEGEHYDLLLLYAAYVLKGKGVRVLYLGTNISTASIQMVLESKKPEIVVTYCTGVGGKRREAFIHLSTSYPGSRFIALTAEPLEEVVPGGSVVFLSYQDVDALLEEDMLIVD